MKPLLRTPPPDSLRPDASDHPGLRYEISAWEDGFSSVAGLDEAGRGPLAGPVVACAVLMDRTLLQSGPDGFFDGLNDSKQMTATARNHFFQKLTSHNLVRFGVGSADVAEIDDINILRATHLAMKRALEKLCPLPDLVLVDGLPVPGLPCKSRSIVKGDAQSLSIAAGSVIAKVTRDEIMSKLDAQFPGYGFARHKGYGTRAHLEALVLKGPSPAHRRSFQPVRDAAARP